MGVALKLKKINDACLNRSSIRGNAKRHQAFSHETVFVRFAAASFVSR